MPARGAQRSMRSVAGQKLETRVALRAGTGSLGGSGVRPHVPLPKRWLPMPTLAVVMVATSLTVVPTGGPVASPPPKTSLVSVVGNVQADGVSAHPSADIDGGFVAYASDAGNLDPNSGPLTDVFVEDLAASQPHVVSRPCDTMPEVQGAAGASHEPVLSRDATLVAFTSEASNIAVADTNGVADVYVCLWQEEMSTRVSVSSDGAEANGPSREPAVSDNRVVAFTSMASNLIDDDTNGVADVFVHDLLSGTTERVSITPNGQESNGPSHSPAISADGRYVAFVSSGSNFGLPGGVSHVWLRDRLAHSTSLVSIGVVGPGTGDSGEPSMSSDGSTIAFSSEAPNLVMFDTNESSDIFVRHVVGGVSITEITSASSLGIQGNDASNEPSVSPDGNWIAFTSAATNLTPGDTNEAKDIFVRDVSAGTTGRASLGVLDQEGNGDSTMPVITDKGKRVVFRSAATNLVESDTNNVADIFVREWRGSGYPTSVMEIIPNVGAEPLTVDYDASASTDEDDETLAYSWDFGDGGKSTTVSGQHVYLSAGIYSVTLTVTDDDGNTDSEAGVVVVSDEPGGPAASFGAHPQSGCVPFTAEFDAKWAMDPDGTIVDYEWDFGDNKTGSGSTISHNYGQPGTYQVKLTVTDNDGKTHEKTLPVSGVACDQPPVVTFEEASADVLRFGDVNGPGRSTLRASATDDDAVVEYHWNITGAWVNGVPGNYTTDFVTPASVPGSPAGTTMSSLDIDPIALGITPPAMIPTAVQAVDSAGQKSAWAIGPMLKILDPNATGDNDGDGYTAGSDPNDEDPDIPEPHPALPVRAIYTHNDYDGLLDRSIVPQTVSVLAGDWAYSRPMDLKNQRLFANTPWQIDLFTGQWIFGDFPSVLDVLTGAVSFNGTVRATVMVNLWADSAYLTCTENGMYIDWVLWSVCDTANLEGVALVLGINIGNPIPFTLNFQRYHAEIDDDMVEISVEQRDEVDVRTWLPGSWWPGWPGNPGGLEWRGKTGYASDREIYVRPIVRKPLKEEGDNWRTWKP